MIIPVTGVVKGVAVPSESVWSSGRATTPCDAIRARSSSVLVAPEYSPLLHCDTMPLPAPMIGVQTPCPE